MNTLHIRVGLIGGLLVIVCGSTAFAWTGPTGTAPTNNVAAPINVSTAPQIKNGDLGVNNLLVSGNLQLAGSSATSNGTSNAYLAFGSETGNAIYGLRDNSGTIQVKDYGGNWSDVSGLSPWDVSGTTIYYTGGSVGIGTSSPNRNLTVTRQG